MSKTPLLSVIIPGRQEEFFARTVEDVLRNMRGDSEIVAICDASWPEPPLADHPKLTVLHFTESVGQRAAVNYGARISRAKYVMKIDAHCTVDEGFDLKLTAPYEDGRLGMDVTTIPRMFNLHAFSWRCKNCGNEQYQGPQPETCKKSHEIRSTEGCGGKDFDRVLVWKPRMNRRTDFARFNHEMQFKYDGRYERRHPVEAQKDIADLMSSVGCCFFMRRDRFWAQGGMIEAHGSWGNFGTEVSCKAWLSGGRQVLNKTTWISHLFRTQPGFNFPYPISGNAQDRARAYSRDLWMNNKWPLQVLPLSWLIEKFAPIPDWHDPIGADALRVVTEAGKAFDRR